MRNFVIVPCIVLIASATQAQVVDDVDAQIFQPDRTAEFRNELITIRKALEARGAPSGALTEDEVGDVDSFGRAKIYLGVEQTLPVVISTDCSGSDPDFEVCVEPAPAPASTAVNETDLGSIELPANATSSLLCFTFTQFATWNWLNSTGATQTASMALRPTVQIANDALIGLSDSNGNPFNGTLFVDYAPITVYTSQHTLPDGASEFQTHTVTRSCTGGIVSARSLAAEGLTDTQIKDFFKSPMTISFGTAGSFSLVDFGFFFAGIRLYGDD